MEIRTVHTGDRSLLRAVRDTLIDADEAVLAVAFASEQGVNLIGKELRALGDRTRLLLTTTFGTTTLAAMAVASQYGTQVRIINPAGPQTYHPKLYMARRADGSAVAVIGSANLTGGLVNNVELATHLRGSRHASPLADAWTFATALWERIDALDWLAPDRAAEAAAGSVFDTDLHALLEAAVADDPTFMTLGSTPRHNEVVELTAHGLYVATARTVASGRGPQPVPAWMFELAWDFLRTHGELTNTVLLNELRVHRSSAVCAILARLPPVEVVSHRPIRLRWRG